MINDDKLCKCLLSHFVKNAEWPLLQCPLCMSLIPKSQETYQFKSKRKGEIKKVFKQISKDIEPQCIQVSADVYEKFGPNLPRA